MRVGSRLLAVCCALIMAASAQSASVGWLGELPESVTVHRTKAGIVDEAGWYDAVSSKGGFEVRLPVTFEDWSAVLEPDGLLAHSVGGTSPEGIVLLATEFPLVGSMGGYNIKQLTERLLPEVSGLRTRYFKRRGMDVSQARFKRAGRRVTLRHIIAGNKLYRLSVESPLEHKRKARVMETTFYLSFRLKTEKSLADF